MKANKNRNRQCHLKQNNVHFYFPAISSQNHYKVTIAFARNNGFLYFVVLSSIKIENIKKEVIKRMKTQFFSSCEKNNFILEKRIGKMIIY